MKPIIAALVLLFGSLTASAADLKTPDGTVILTVAGNVANANRPAFDPDRDGILKYHDRKFARAAAFDLAMLEALGMRTATISYAGWPAPVAFAGPRLADVLKAAGAGGGAVTTLALDGFGTTIDRAVLDAHDWILATRADGRPLGIGERGPLWLVFAPPGGRPATAEEEQMWPWALFYLEVE